MRDPSAAPTFTMLAILRKMVEVDGVLVERTKIPRGYQVIAKRNEAMRYWFPTYSGRGLIKRGMIDANGHITESGRAAAWEDIVKRAKSS